MTRSARQSLNRWSIAAYVCISAALVFVVLFGVWGAYRDLKQIRTTALQSEIIRLRSQALRTVGHIESKLDEQAGQPDLYTLRTDAAFRRYWQRIEPRQPEQRLFVAIVDAAGIVVMHTNPEHEDRSLERRWYERVVAEAGADVLETRSAALAGGERSFDIRIPIVVGEMEVGEHHVGFDTAWFESWLADKRARFLGWWTMVIGATLLMVLLAVISLWYVAQRKAALGQAVNLAQFQRVTELGQLAAGLAHEIRNPLHAIRLNLHSLALAYQDNSRLTAEEVSSIIGESNREIDRMDRLMRELLGFARPEEPQEKRVDVRSEVQATLNFVRQEMARKQVEVCTHFPQEPVLAHLDPSRLRQIMLNLLMNSFEAMEQGGQIDVSIGRRAQRVVITVADNGPGISESEREQIFEPFFSTKDNGSGLGLALVKRFVNEAHGTIEYEANLPRGARFRIELPAAKPNKREK